MPQSRNKITLKVLAYVGTSLVLAFGAICGGLVCFANSIFHVNEVKLDAYGQKGVDMYKELGGLDLPANTVCLKGNYESWQEWHYYFVFWSPSAPNFPTWIAKKEGNGDLVWLQEKMNQVPGNMYPLKNPQPSGKWLWGPVDSVYYEVESVRCDDGFYTYARIGTM